MLKYWLTVIGCLTMGLSAAAQGKLEPYTLTASADAAQPADAPVLVTLTFANHSSTPVTYWCGGPGDFPSSSHVSGAFTNAANEKREFASPANAGMAGIKKYADLPTLGNGQYDMGSGRDLEIAPGAEKSIPVAISPLPPGVYTFTFTISFTQDIRAPKLISAETQIPITVNVKRDIDLAIARNRMLMQNERAGQPFASFVISHYDNRVAITSLLHDLTRANISVVRSAWSAIGYTHLPAGSGHIIAEDFKQIRQRDGMLEHERAGYLFEIAKSCGDRDALKAVERVLDGWKGDDWARARAAEALGEFAQPEVALKLKALLSDSNPEVRSAAQTAIAKRKIGVTEPH